MKDKKKKLIPAEPYGNIDGVDEAQTPVADKGTATAVSEAERKKNIDVHFENTDFAKSIDATAAPVILKGREKRRHRKHKLSPAAKTGIAVFCLAVICIGIYILYYLVHYKWFDDYKDYLKGYNVAEATEYKPLTNTGEVAGFDLVAENDILKLFTNTATGNIAVYDKRNKSITYSNPLDADDDPIANAKNKGYMKAQFQVFFYNADVKSDSYDSYANSVAKKQYSYESIENGVRYIYTVGNPKPKKDGSTEIYFEITVDYTLDGDSVEVSVPVNRIKEFGGGSIYRIQLMKYMGAASADEDGYIVVPNASGSLIDFNNGKTTAGTYQQYIYDIDPLTQSLTTTEKTSSCKMPIMGICREDRSLLVSVENGATTTVFTAGIAGSLTNYNYAFPTFVLRNVDNLRNFGNSNLDVFVLEPYMYDIDCRVRYSFLTEENKGYAGIANYYRERLISKGILTKQTADEDIPFYYDIIAGIQGTEHFLGVQYLKTMDMTSFGDAMEIASQLSSGGIRNQVMNLQGWFNEGYYHDAADSIKIIGKLGGRSGLKDLQSALNSNGGKLYADVAFQKVTFADDGFNYDAEGARYYGAGYCASFGQVNPTTFSNGSGMLYTEIRYDLLSPKFLPRYVRSFAKKIQDISVDGVSLRDLGDTLCSDKNRKEIINRDQALAVVQGQFEILEETGKSIMTSSANSYCWDYCDDIINVPVTDNNYYLVDHSIPLYEMIIHGCIDYGSTLLNFEDSTHMDKTELQLIEAGCSPHFVFTWEESSKMKDTAMNSFYSTTFSTWKDQAISVYSSVNEVLKHVEGSCIIGHEIYENGVRKVTYDNGVSIYINYSDEQLAADDGIMVEAMSYRLEGTD